MTPPRVSVAIAVYNEELVLPELIRRTRDVLDALPGGPHELVFVDDGSSDRTFELLEAATADPRIAVVSLSRNFGHQAALSAALDHVSGDVVVVMDGDLQDTPETIPRMLEEYRRGFDVVYAVRTRRKEGFLLRSAYAAFYRLMAALADIAVPVGAGDFSLLSRRVVDELRAAPERHRYLRGLRTWVGFRQTGIEVERAARAGGKPKYNLRRLFRLAFDGIFAFSVVPLRLATLLGVCAVCLSLVFAAYALYVKLRHQHVIEGFTATLLVITLLSGVQLLSLGIIGEYLGRIYDEAKRRPHYVVRTRRGLAGPPGGGAS
jgi:polyisoprenyl-phosphate glycosyltransferase